MTRKKHDPLEYHKPRNLLEALRKSKGALRDPFLREVQRAYDERQFDKTYGLESLPRSSRDAKAEHVGKHIVKASVKLFRYIQNPTEHALSLRAEREVLGDLPIYRTQLANLLSYNLTARLGRVKTEEDSPGKAYVHLQDAVEVAADFGEMIEHEYPRGADRSNLKEVAIPALHMSALILSNHFEINSSQAHIERLASNIGVTRIIS